MLDKVIHIALVLGLPPLLFGVVNKTKALFAGRNGPPLLQLYYDLWKLVRKDSVFSRTTTWVFRAGPVVGLATALIAACFLPLGGRPAFVSFDADFVVFAYLLGLARFFTVAAALDTGSAFEGMGGAREVTFSCLAEPALFFSMLVLGKTSGSLSLGTMLGPSLAAAWSSSPAPLLLVLASLFIVLLTETCRIPVDDPNTHLELTMIHEVMVLDHSGPALGMILYGSALKLFVFAALVARVAVPYVGAAAPSWAVFIASMLALAIAIGIVESSMARLRLLKVPSFLVAACLLSGLSIALVAG